MKRANKMAKRALAFLMVFCLLLMGTGCSSDGDKNTQMGPQVEQMKAICELAVMECYYHNVAKYKEEDAAGMLWWEKDKHFWIEYSGIVTIGIDVSRVDITVEGEQVTITLPPAEVFSCKVDPSSLSKDSFIVDKDSASIKAEDEVNAFDEAQRQLEESAASDRVLLANAQQQAKTLLGDYISNIGNAVGKEYVIQWVYLDEEEQQAPSESAVSEPISVPVA